MEQSQPGPVRGGVPAVDGRRQHLPACAVARGRRWRALASAPRVSWPPRSPAARAAARSGIVAGDVLLAVATPVDHPEDVLGIMHGAERGRRLTYTILRGRAEQVREVSLEPVPQGNRALYFVLAGLPSLRCSSGRRAGVASPGAGDAATSSGCRSPSSAYLPSRSAAASTGSTGCSTGPTSLRC